MQQGHIVFLNFLDQTQGGRRILTKVPALKSALRSAIVTRGIAIFLVERLIEIVQDLNPSAIALVLTELEDVSQHLPLTFLLLEAAFSVVDHTLEGARILVPVVQEAAGFLAVSSSTTGLLIVALKTFWDGIVDDKANVWLVYSHPEGNGCNNNIGLASLPLLLNFLLLFRLHACMVVMSHDSVLFSQLHSNVFTILLGQTINDARLPLVGGINRFRHTLEDVFRLAFASDFIMQVGPVETLREDIAILHSKIVHNVDFDIFGGRRSQSNNWHTPELLSYFT